MTAVKSKDVLCPDGTSVCPNGNTCCKLESGEYGCCPLPNAECCSDGVHCCPSGYTCGDGFCTKGNHKIRASIKSNALSVKSTVCPDRETKCPSGSKCCRHYQGYFLYFCCPSESKCGFNKCEDESQNVEDFIKRKELTKANIVCPDRMSQCPDANTCCKLESGEWGCCPLPNAVCCSDHQHCCPSGYSCGSGGK